MAERGFTFWALTPFLIAFMCIMPLVLIDNNRTAAVAGIATVEVMAGLMLLGLFDSQRFAWAWRGVAGLVCSGCSLYLITMIVTGAPILTDRKSEPTLFNSVCAMLLFGVPAFWYAVFGRLPGESRDEATYADQSDNFED